MRGGNRMPIALRTPERPSATHKATGTATGTATGANVHSPTADAQGSSASEATRNDLPTADAQGSSASGAGVTTRDGLKSGPSGMEQCHN